MRLSIRGGRVIDPANGIDRVTDLHIADGRIASLDQAPAGFVAETQLDASGQIVCPGLVDLCARLREPGLEHKATIASESRAAAASGITTLCFPPDTQPVIDTPAVVELIRQRAETAGTARVVPLGALTQQLGGQHLSEMMALKAAGVAGVSNAWRPIVSSLVMRRALEYAATHDLTVFINPQDDSLCNKGCAHEGAISTRFGLPGIPEAAETAQVARDLVLIEQTGVRAHFSQLSSASAARMLGRAQHDGLPVTADVSIHHLYLTEIDVAQFDSYCHVRPPLRTQADRDGLRQGLARGVLTGLCSDHQPHEEDAKLAPFVESEPGISGLETLLPLTLRLVEEGVLSLSEALARVTCGPAAVLGIDAGTLASGATADICVFDPQRVWQVSADTLVSRGHNTPFWGWEMTGRVTHTLLGGRVVYTLGTSD